VTAKVVGSGAWFGFLFFIELGVSRDIAAKSPRYKTDAETNQKNAEQ